MTKLYVSEHNYYPGRQDLPKGTVFSEQQWIDAGGSATGLGEHISRGYIKEAVQQAPVAVIDVPAETVDTSEADRIAEEEAEAKAKAEAEEEAALQAEAEAQAKAEAEAQEQVDKEAAEAEEAAKKAAAEGIWNFERELLENYDLQALNIMYADRAEQNGLEVAPFEDRDKLIDLMTSQAVQKD